jgi:hypothetical protein
LLLIDRISFLSKGQKIEGFDIEECEDSSFPSKNERSGRYFNLSRVNFQGWQNRCLNVKMGNGIGSNKAVE